MSDQDSTAWSRAEVGGQPPCPACGLAVEVGEEVFLGEVLWCPSCGAELEAISVDPLRLELFEDEEK
jgi:alpha-aminoadipate carrier protein LysW